MAITIKDTVYLGAAKPSSGGGSSNYNDLSNKPQINGVTLSGNKTSADLGIKGTVQIAIEGTTTYESFRIPDPTAEEVTAIYNAVVAGSSVQIVDPYDVYYQVLQADSSDSVVSIEISYFSTMFLVYTLENNSVSVTAHKNQEKITGTPKNILVLNVNGDVSNTKLDSELVDLHDTEVESLSGLAETQAEVNEEFVDAFVEVLKITETITGNTPTIANVQGNHIYNCTGTLTSLTLTAVETTYNEATIYMTTGASITVDVPASVKTIGYTEFNPNTSYVISFANNTMIVGEINA